MIVSVTLSSDGKQMDKFVVIFRFKCELIVSCCKLVFQNGALKLRTLERILTGKARIFFRYKLILIITDKFGVLD